MQHLAAADALTSLSGHRGQQVWQATALGAMPPLLQGALAVEEPLDLPAAPEGEEVVWDYAALGLMLCRHPLKLLHSRLAKLGLKNAAEPAQWPNGQNLRHRDRTATPADG